MEAKVLEAKVFAAADISTFTLRTNYSKIYLLNSNLFSDNKKYCMQNASSPCMLYPSCYIFKYIQLL